MNRALPGKGLYFNQLEGRFPVNLSRFLCVKKVFQNGREGLFLRRRAPRRGGEEKEVEISAELRQKTGQKAVQLGIFLSQGRDLPDGVQCRRVVLVGKEGTDLGQGEPGRFLEDVHRHLPRKDDRSTLRARTELGGLEAIVRTDEFQNVGGRRRMFFRAKKVPPGLPGGIPKKRLAPPGGGRQR